MSLQNNIQIYADPAALSAAAAMLISDVAHKAVAEKGRFAISLSGGHTPERLFALLAKPEYMDSIPWKDTFVFWGDERCVPLHDKDNNARMAIDVLLSKVRIPQENIKRIPVALPPAEAAEAYEHTLKAFFGNDAPVFDLILLGLGENGHTASLFPGTDVLLEQKRWVKEVYVAEQGMYRITMTAPLINQANIIAFLLEGKSKADIVHKLLEPQVGDSRYPAQLIQPAHGSLHWMMDREAAGAIDALGI